MEKIPKTSGIYQIRNLVNGKVYIGSSNNLYRRKIQHLNNLRKNRHINKHLQNAFNKYGEACLQFEVLEQCDIDNLYIREQYYINEKYGDNCYNINTTVEVPPNMSKTIICLENKCIYSSIKEAAVDVNIHFSTISACLNGKIKTAKKLHWMFLTDYNKLTVEEINNILREKKRPKQCRQKRKCLCIETQQIFNSITEASKSLSLSPSKITEVCQGKRKTTGNLHFKFIG